MADILREIVQGNTGTLYKEGVKGCPDLSEGAPDYTCKLSVPSAGTPIARSVTTLIDANTRFAVQLTRAETTDLAADTRHTMYIEIENLLLIPIFTIETSVEFFVKPQVIL